VLVKQLQQDYTQADLSPRVRALLDYATQLTRTPWQLRRSDLDPLRAAGLSDRDILDLNLVVAYYGYVNRLADGLGVPLEEWWNEHADTP
jgi:uncharacterized peroxidase-related enzyme